jgi:hypothetical protein
MGKKADADHTPERDRQPQRVPGQRDQDNAETVVPPLDPSLSDAMAAQQERLRQFSEEHGLKEIAERLRKAKPEPQDPTPRRKPRKQGGGRKPLFDEQQKTWLQEKYSLDLKTSPRLARHKEALPHVEKLAETEYGILAGPDTLLDQIIRPVLLAYFSMEK